MNDVSILLDSGFPGSAYSLLDHVYLRIHDTEDHLIATNYGMLIYVWLRVIKYK